MSEDDEEDWFERALREGDDEPDGDAVGTTEPPEDPDDGDGPDPTAGRDVDDEGGFDEEAFEASVDEMDDIGESGGLDDANDADVDDDAGEDNPFEEDFAAAFQNAPAPGGESGGGGAAGMDMPDTGGFEEEDYESDIPRIDIGIEGLDQMIQGGVPERSLMVTIGSAGTGKTTIGLQFLRHALANDERAVFITLEESKERIINTADDKGWNFSTYVADGQLAIVDLDPIEMANSLQSIRSELPELIREFGASRLVLDSVSLLEMMYDNQATRRNEVYDFTQSLKSAGVTTLFTSEASASDPYASRFGIIEYLTDAVLVLRYIRPEDFRETRLAIEIQKIRDANHSREMKPYELTNEGVSVYRQANIF